MAPAEKLGFYLSGKAAFEYGHEDWVWPVLFELERTELSFHPAQAVNLSLGRVQYGDTGGMIASGLFDGLYGSFGLGRVRLSGGVLYTGFLYKETAEIIMTLDDEEQYAKPLDYGNPDHYFASRRLLLPAGLEFSDISSRLSLRIDGIAQFDLNGEATALHTQYLEIRLGIEVLDSLRFDVTGIGALGEGEETWGHLAGALGADWDVPGGLRDMVSGELRWGGGAVNEKLRAFTPVSRIAQGTIFTPVQAGLLTARSFYTVRPFRRLSVSAGGIVFWRSDLETFRDAELDRGSKERFLGGELYGQAAWGIQSALRLSCGGGVFFPGGAFVEDAGIRWKITGGIILSM
jgi:hypothetical protein